MKKILITFAAAAIMVSACHTGYQVASVERQRILVDARYDVHPDKKAVEFLAPYKKTVDSVMGPVVGRSSHYMTAQRPEGDLSNLLADILVWAGESYGEQPVFGVYNMGGVRAALPKGEVTYGDVLDVAPFENKIAFATLSGADVLQLFREIARVGGEGLSHSVRLVISRKGELLDATINGEPVVPAKDYRITTIDYLLGGTDHMTAFKKCRNINSPQNAENNSRFVIMNYFREQTRLGREVDAKIEGRVTVKD